MGLLAQLRDRAGGVRARFGRELRAAYLDARRIAVQLRRDAARVPYPGLGAELTRLADLADGHAADLARELGAVAGNTDPSDATAPREGHNHWERLSFDLADLESLRRRLTQLALHWDVDFPDTVATFERMAHTTAVMSKTVSAMLARSDPHAAGR